MKNNNIVSVGIADDHAIFRKGVTVSLRHYATEIVFELEASNGIELVAKLKSTKIDVLLLDINMPGDDGLTLLPFIKKEYPKIKVIMLSMYTDLNYIYEALDNGASSYLFKNVEPSEIYSAILSSLSKGIYLNNYLKNAVIERKNNQNNPLPVLANRLNLSPIELIVLADICESKTNVTIAAQQDLSKRGVEKVRLRLFEKFGVKSTIGLVVAAIKQKII